MVKHADKTYVAIRSYLVFGSDPRNAVNRSVASQYSNEPAKSKAITNLGPVLKKGYPNVKC